MMGDNLGGILAKTALGSEGAIMKKINTSLSLLERESALGSGTSPALGEPMCHHSSLPWYSVLGLLCSSSGKSLFSF